MATITEPRPGECRFTALVRLLGAKDSQIRQQAAAMFRQLGKPAALALVYEAVKPGVRSQHRIAILDVIEQIGTPLGIENMLVLQSLLRHRHPAVRTKTERTIMAMSPGGFPKTPKSLAAERVFNPYLHLSFAATLRGGRAAIRRMAGAEAARLRREQREQDRRS